MARLAAAGLAIVLVGSGAEDARAQRFRVEPIAIPMRDGQTLAADLIRPNGQSGPWPVVLVQTPYNKDPFAEGFLNAPPEDPLFTDTRFAWVCLDWRGFHASSGAASTSATLARDGFDAVQWVASQTWCTGNVGTWGSSALAVAQYQTATQRPPALKACVPQVGNPTSVYESYYGGGILYRNTYDFIGRYFLGGSSFVTDNPLRNSTWEVVDGLYRIQVGQMNVPMLHVSGWYDHNTPLTFEAWRRIADSGGPNAKGRQWLLCGPWSHNSIGDRRAGQLEYPSAEYASQQQIVAFFEHTLLGIDNGWESTPRLRYFQTNEDRFFTGDTWPPPEATSARLWFEAAGGLSATEPGATATRTFVSDPERPVPTLYGAVLTAPGVVQGPGNLSLLTARADVLTYTTPPLAEPLRIAGNPTATMRVEASTPDIDVSIRLCHLDSQGRTMLIIDAAQRASLRDSLAQKSLLAPGEPVEVTVQFAPLAFTIPAGDRLRVLVAASNFPRFDMNPQDGSDFRDSPGAQPAIATVLVHHGGAGGSRLDLPLLPAPAPSGWVVR